MSNRSSANIVVLYGAMRSGTTLMRLMLDAHPKINCPGERDYLLDHLQVTDEQLLLRHDDMRNDRMFKAANKQVPATSDGLAAFWDLVGQDVTGSEDQVMCLVMHRRVDLLLDIFPDARILHLIRDPRDVARSSIRMGWAGNVYYGVDHWVETERQWDRAAGSVAEDRLCSVRYEDLLENPEEELGRICAFVGLQFDAEMLHYDKTSTYSKVDPKLAYQWKHKQAPSDVGELEYKIGDLLIARGYEPSGYTIIQPTALRRLTLRVRNRIAVIKERSRSYGLGDVLLLALARRLRWRSLHRTVQFRIDEKTTTLLK